MTDIRVCMLDHSFCQLVPFLFFILFFYLFVCSHFLFCCLEPRYWSKPKGVPDPSCRILALLDFFIFFFAQWWSSSSFSIHISSTVSYLYTHIFRELYTVAPLLYIIVSDSGVYIGSHPEDLLQARPSFLPRCLPPGHHVTHRLSPWQRRKELGYPIYFLLLNWNLVPIMRDLHIARHTYLQIFTDLNIENDGDCRWYTRSFWIPMGLVDSITSSQIGSYRTREYLSILIDIYLSICPTYFLIVLDWVSIEFGNSI